MLTASHFEPKLKKSVGRTQKVFLSIESKEDILRLKFAMTVF
jgi:hypothetical protein